MYVYKFPFPPTTFLCLSVAYFVHFYLCCSFAAKSLFPRIHDDNTYTGKVSYFKSPWYCLIVHFIDFLT